MPPVSGIGRPDGEPNRQDDDLEPDAVYEVEDGVVLVFGGAELRLYDDRVELYLHPDCPDEDEEIALRFLPRDGTWDAIGSSAEDPGVDIMIMWF